MDLEYENKYHKLEQTHWWFLKRRELIVDWVGQFPKDVELLDIGCSSGALLTDLEAQGFSNLHGIDISGPAVELSKQYGHQNSRVMDGGNITFESERFDVLVSSDCLEHIEDDVGAIEHWFRILKPGGTLILFVPAFMFLWSTHDEANHHYRRYTKKQVAQQVMDVGFQLKRNGYWNFFLFPTIAVVRLFQRLLPKSNKRVDNLHQPSSFVNNILSGITHVENKILRNIDLPVGVSTYVVAQKPK